MWLPQRESKVNRLKPDGFKGSGMSKFKWRGADVTVRHTVTYRMVCASIKLSILLLFTIIY